MRKIIAAALAGTMLVTASGAAMAQPWHGPRGYVHYDRGWHHGDAGAAIGLGLGLFALGAIVASSQDHYGPPPPPPPPYPYGYYYGR